VHSSAGRSNALNIASRLGLDAKIIEVARERLAVGVAAANAAIEALESVQKEVREADMVLFAVSANAAETKVRMGLFVWVLCEMDAQILYVSGCVRARVCVCVRGGGNTGVAVRSFYHCFTTEHHVMFWNRIRRSLLR
jgi:uncharacterized membrane-anchored protein